MRIAGERAWAGTDRMSKMEIPGQGSGMDRICAAALKSRLEMEISDWGQVQELRFRAGRPVVIRRDGREYFIRKDSGLGSCDFCREPGEGGAAVFADSALIRELMEILTGHSIYAFEEEIRQGFFTIQGGHRVGLCGKTVVDGGKIRTIKEISGLNIRLAHQKRGCADAVLRRMFDGGSLLSTLFLSPPGAGKTTMLRDVIRQISDGGRNRPGLDVSVVDERSELAACCQGVPQNDLGMRTDVLDACPKAEGMMMMIRSMTPQAAAVDEVGTREDLEAMRYVMNCGCKILATAHASGVEDLRVKPVLCEMAKERMFERYVVLEKTPHPGHVKGIYDGNLKELTWV